MTQISPVQIPQYRLPQMPQQNYNAVKIDIHNPQVNAPNYNQNPIEPTYTAPVYSYPEAPIYEVPKKSIYEPQAPCKCAVQPKEVKEAPAVPPPSVVQPAEVKPAVKAEAVAEVPAAQPTAVEAINSDTKKIEATAPVSMETAKVAEEIKKSTEAPTEVKDAEQTPVPAQTVEVKKPEEIAQSVDINAFISKLSSSNLDEQATTMASIAEMTQAAPDKAVDLLDVRVVDTLLGIMTKDTSSLPGPTPSQLQARVNILEGKKVSEAEMVEANKITPMEQAERNKQFAIYTVATMQKLYSSEIQKMNNTVVPMTELPGAAGIVEQVKNNPNPMVRVAGLDALSFIQRPEYKKDLNTLFNVAKNDQDVNVQKAAAKALEKLAKVADAPVEAPAAKA